MNDAMLKPGTIEVDEIFPHAPETIWKALVIGDLVGRWLMEPKGFEPVVGNRFTFQTTPASKEKGTVIGEQCTCWTQCGQNTCPGCPTCDGTCNASCNGTCGASCGASCDYSCGGTCDYSCDCSNYSCDYTCDGYAKCTD